MDIEKSVVYIWVWTSGLWTKINIEHVDVDGREFYPWVPPEYLREPFFNSKSPTFKPTQITIFQALISTISWNYTDLYPNTDSPCKFPLSATATVSPPFFTLSFALYPKALPVSSSQNCGQTAPVSLLWFHHASK